MPTTKKAEGILVVDDEEPIREIISAMLSTGGYQRRKTASGLEALDRVQLGRKIRPYALWSVRIMRSGHGQTRKETIPGYAYGVDHRDIRYALDSHLHPGRGL
jgi:CheY-like chemotaxis protein